MSRVSQSFSQSTVGPGPAILLSDQSTASIVVNNSGGGFTMVPQVTSDSDAAIQAGAATWVTATTVGGGSISAAGTYVGNIAGLGLTALRYNLTAITSGTISGNIAASEALALAGGGGATSTVNLTQVGGTNVSLGQAAMAASIPVAIASNQSAVPTTVAAGSAIIGKVGIDQTTPGTTNGVQVNAALPAGTNIIGKTGIDQTTPGTTNAVQVTTASPGGATANPAYARIQDESGTTAATVTANKALKADTSLSASSTATLTSVASSATTVSLLALNTARKGFIIFNDSTQLLYVAFAATASTSAYSYQVQSQGTLEGALPVYQGAISGIWASANGNARISELT